MKHQNQFACMCYIASLPVIAISTSVPHYISISRWYYTSTLVIPVLPLLPVLLIQPLRGLLPVVLYSSTPAICAIIVVYTSAIYCYSSIPATCAIYIYSLPVLLNMLLALLCCYQCYTTSTLATSTCVCAAS